MSPGIIPWDTVMRYSALLKLTPDIHFVTRHNTVFLKPVRAPSLLHTSQDKGENLIWLNQVLPPLSWQPLGWCLSKLFGWPGLLLAEWCRVCDLDPMWLQDNLLDFKNAVPRTLWCGSYIQHCPTLMMVVWQSLYAAGGRADFLLTRNCLTERQVRGVWARQIL